jgi:hypothetical protein
MLVPGPITLHHRLDGINTRLTIHCAKLDKSKCFKEEAWRALVLDLAHISTISRGRIPSAATNYH